MKTNSNIFNKTSIPLLFAGILFFSCNNEKVEREGQHHVHNDSIREKLEDKMDSAQVFFDNQKQKLSEKISRETETVDKKIEELKQIQEKEKTKTKTKIQQEITELQVQKDRLKDLWSKLEQATKDNWRSYEKEINKIMEENKKKKEIEKNK